MDSETDTDVEPRGRTILRRRSSIFSLSPSPPPPLDDDLQAFTSDKRHLSMIRQLQLADWITMLNCYCGFNSIISSAHYIESGYLNSKYAYRALLFTFAGFFFDVFDGRVARWQGRSSPLGKELDSLADLVSFGVAPATVAFALGLQTTVDVALLSMFVLCGLLRLARFNVTAAVLSKGPAGSGKVSHFEGLPIPTSLGLVLIMLLAYSKGNVHQNIPGGTLFADSWLQFHPAVLLFTALGCAYVSKSLKIPKL